MLNYF